MHEVGKRFSNHPVVAALRLFSEPPLERNLTPATIEDEGRCECQKTVVSWFIRQNVSGASHALSCYSER
jgi:hypothetical protein